MPDKPNEGPPDRAKTPDELEKAAQNAERNADFAEGMAADADRSASASATNVDAVRAKEADGQEFADAFLGVMVGAERSDAAEASAQGQAGLASINAQMARNTATRLRERATEARQAANWARRAIAGALITFGGLMTVGGLAGAGSTGTGTTPTAQPTATLGTPAPSGSAAPNLPPVVGPIIAVFNAPQTSYTVQATDPEGKSMTYTWTKTNPCGTFTFTNNIAIWNHPDVPGGCPAEDIHPGTITVNVSDGVNQVQRVYTQGSAPGTGNVPPAATPLPTTTSRAATATATSTSTPTPSSSPAPGGGGPNVPLTGAGLLIAGAGGLLVAQDRKKKDPCDKEKAAVEAAKAELAAARARQQRINGLKSANDKAQADLNKAQSEFNSATDPKSTTWVEVDGGERHYSKSSQARVDQATAALAAAKSAAAAAKSAWDGAGDGNEVRDAGYAVEDGERHLRNAEEALARCLQVNAPPPPPPPPPTTPPPPPPPTQPSGGTTYSPPTPTTPGTVSRPPLPPTVEKPKKPKHECEDGDEPREEKTEKDFELYLIWAGQWKIDGTFQFSSDDVDEALENYKKFKLVVDIAQVFEGFAGSGGAAAAAGEADIGAVLNVFTQGVKAASGASDVPNPIDPSDASQWGAEQAIEKLINRINRLRGNGFWSLTCPRVRVHVTCTKTYECVGNRWQLTKHDFKIEYGDKVGELTLPRDPNQGIVANDSNGQHSAAMRRRLTNYFEGMNRGPMGQIKTMAQRCAAR